MRIWATILLAAVPACLAGEADRPLGSTCSDDGECAGELICRYGRCRSRCDFDRDCPPGAACVASPGGTEGRSCTGADEAGCTGSTCPEGLGCAPDGACRELCPEDGAPCDGPRSCSEGPVPVCEQLSLSAALTCFEVLASDPGACRTDVPSAAESTTLDGLEAGVRYVLTARFRGVVEWNSYIDGVGALDGTDSWYVGGQAGGEGWNVYSLSVAAPEEVYYLNGYQHGIYQIVPLDFERSFPVLGGTTLTLAADAGDGLQVMNPQEGEDLVTAPGLPPPPEGGQLIRMDVLSAVAE